MKFDHIGGQVLSLFRMVTGLLFLCHGLSSIFGVLGGNRGTGQVIPVGTWPGWWAAAIQVVFGALVLAGLVTRLSALLCSGSMAFAYFTVHAPHDLFPIRNGGDLAVMFCWSFLLIAVFGPGVWSLDALVRRARRAEPKDLAPARV
jgi:putative oxidoreductase